MSEPGEDDLRCLARLQLLTWDRECHEDNIAREVECLRPAIEEMNRSGGAILIANRGGEPVGCAWVRRDRETTAQYWWEGVAVHPGARGLGVARGLFHLAERYTREHGGWLLRSEAHADNAASIRMHERLGFRRVGVFTSPHDGDRKVAFAMDVREKYHE